MPKQQVASGAAPCAVAAAAAWREVRWEVHPSPYGVPYYYNASSGESRWALPTGPHDVVVMPDSKRTTSDAEDVAAPKGACKSTPCETTPATAGGGHWLKRKCDGTVPHSSRVCVDVSSGNSPAGSVVKAPGTSSGGSSSSSSSAGSSSESEDEAKKRELNALKDVATKLEDFRYLLQERGVGRFDRYESWRPRLLNEARFVAVPADMRKPLFLREVRRLGEQQSITAAATRRKSRKALELLLNTACDRGMLADVENPTEVIATISQSDLGVDIHWTNATACEKERLVTKMLKELSEQKAKHISEASHAFRDLLKEKILIEFTSQDQAAPWGEVRRTLREEPRFKALGSTAMRQQIYAEIIADAEQRRLQTLRQQKHDKDEIAEHRKRSRRAEIEDELRCLLKEHVKFPLEVSWAEAKVILDGTGVPAELDDASCEAVFNEVVSLDRSKRLLAFAQALRQAPADTAGAEMSFEEVRDVVAPTLAGGSAQLRGVRSIDLRRCWEDWRRLRLDEAAQVFQKWLRELGDLGDIAADSQSHSGQGAAFEELCARLSGDSRFKRLDALPGKRRQLLAARLQEVTAERAGALKAKREEQGENEED